MEYIELEVKINKEIDVQIHIGDVIDGINHLPMVKRWNYIGRILNEIQLNKEDLTEEQRKIVENYLTEKIKMF